MAAMRVALSALALLALLAAAQQPEGNQPLDPIVDLMKRCAQRAQSAEERARCLALGRGELADSIRGDPEMAGKRGEVYFEQLARRTAEAIVLERVGACIRPPRLALQQRTTCMGQARAELGSALEGLFGPGKSAQAKARQRLEMEKEAARDALGGVFSRCFRLGRGRLSCAGSLGDGKAAAGLDAEDTSLILSRHYARLLARPAQNYSAAGMRQRREDAKLLAIAGGMEPREYAVLKRVGEVRAAAEVWAGCKEAGNDDAPCEGVARGEHARLSGAGAADFDGEVGSKAKSLGWALREGEPVRMVQLKRVLVDARTSGSACAAALEASFAAKVDAITASSAGTQSAVARRCRVVDLEPEYGARVEADLDDRGIEALSERFVAGLRGGTLQRRLQGAQGADLARRLQSLSEVFAEQDVAECGSSDAACLRGELPPTPAPTEVGGAGRAAAAAALSLATAGLALF